MRRSGVRIPVAPPHEYRPRSMSGAVGICQHGLMQIGRSTRVVAVALGATALLSLSACTFGSSGAPATPGASGSALTDVPGLDQTALDVMNQPAYAAGQWAISVQDLDTGEQIVSLNAD